LNYCFLALLISGISIFFWVKPNITARIVIYSSFSAIILARCAWTLFTHGAPKLHPSYRFTASIFGIYSALLLLRMLCTLLSPHPQLFANDWGAWLLLFTATMLPIAGTFGIFMMTNARLTHELQLTEEGLRTMATTDSLTGTLNRRSFIEMALHEQFRAKRANFPMTLIMIDIDHYKKINDKYGHQIGDYMLCVITDTLRLHLRACDLLARWGGEEFLILLPDADSDDSRVVAERLRDAIATLTIPVATGTASVTISLGCTAWLSDEDFDLAMTRADLALYQAKDQGRNRVVVLNKREVSPERTR
jgi:diguanylate cyclase (GGDEF)-like protein